MNSLGSGGVMIGARDGLATFMRYLQLYLHHGRLERQNDYRAIVENPEYLRLIKTLWENAEAALVASYKYRALGIDDREKLERVYDSAMMRELDLAFEESELKTDFDPRARKGPWASSRR